MRVGGVDDSGSNYLHAVASLGFNGTSYNITSTNATSGSLGRIGQSSQGIMVVDISRPFIAARAQTTSSSTANGTTTTFQENGSVLHASTTSYTGFTLIPATGNFTGTLRVYGYNN